MDQNDHKMVVQIQNQLFDLSFWAIQYQWFNLNGCDHGYDSGYNRHATGLHDLQVLFGQDATHLANEEFQQTLTYVNNKHTELKDLFGSFNPNEQIYIYI